jgi:hypothetical protein
MGGRLHALLLLPGDPVRERYPAALKHPAALSNFNKTLVPEGANRYEGPTFGIRKTRT